MNIQMTIIPLKYFFFCRAVSTHKLNLPFSVPEGMISKEKDSGITYDLQYIKTRASKGV
jgi:hypothetical protein